MKGNAKKEGIKSLSDAFPEFSAQWDYELNGTLTPESVSYGSQLKSGGSVLFVGIPIRRKLGIEPLLPKEKLNP